MQEVYSIVTSRNASHDTVSYELEVELYVNGSLYESSSQTLTADKKIYTFNYSNIPLGSTVFAKAWIDSISIQDGQSITEQLVYGESAPVKIESASTAIPLKLKWVEKQKEPLGDDANPVVIEITVSDLKNAITNYKPGTYTTYKVKGSMTDNDFDEILSIILQRRSDFEGIDYIGLDLSEITGLSRFFNSWLLHTLVLPVDFSNYERLDYYGNVKVPSDNPNYVYEDDVLYSKDKTTLLSYTSEKTTQPLRFHQQ